MKLLRITLDEIHGCFHDPNQFHVASTLEPWKETHRMVMDQTHNGQMDGLLRGYR